MTDQLGGMCLEVYLAPFQVSVAQVSTITVVAVRILDTDMERAASVTSAVRLLGRLELAVTAAASSLGQE